MGHVHPLPLTKDKTEEDIGVQNPHQEAGEQNPHEVTGNVHPLPFTNPNKVRRKRRVNVLLTFVLLLTLSFICTLSTLIIPRGIQVNYYNVDPTSYAKQVENMLSKFPSSIQKELASSNVEINIVSGVGQCKSEINEYVYQRIPGWTEGTQGTDGMQGLGTPISPSLKGDTKSPEGSGTPCTPISPSGSQEHTKQDKQDYILGCYVCTSQQIYIFIDNILDLTSGNQSLEGTISHEIGHFLWYNVLTIEDKVKLTLCFKSTELANFARFTGNEYCTTSCKEYLSEFLRYYMDPVYRETIDFWGTPCTQQVIESILYSE